MNAQVIGIMRAQVLSKEFADFLDKEIHSRKDFFDMMAPLGVLNDVELAGIIANVNVAFTENKEILLVILGMWLTMRREKTN